MARWQQQCIIGVCWSETLRVNTVYTIEFTPGTIPHAACTLHYTVSVSSFLLLDRVARNQEWQMWVNKGVLRWLDRGAAAALILRVVFFFWWATLNLKKWRNADARQNRDARCVSQSRPDSALRRSSAQSRAWGNGQTRVGPHVSTGRGIRERKHVEVWPGGQRGCREGSPSGSNLAAFAVPAFPSARL